MAEIKTPEIFNQEIAELEAKLAAKKRELAGSGNEMAEKEVFKQVVREHVAPGETAAPTMPIAAAPVKTTASPSAPLTPAVTAKLNTLLQHAFAKGLADAVKEAKKTGDPYFIDLLHDKLADEYYAKLLQARKIQPQ